jgi:hypothetical protein
MPSPLFRLVVHEKVARDDLPRYVIFVARDNPNRAMFFGNALISETDRLQEFPDQVAVFPSIGMTFVVNNPTSHGAPAVD